MAKVNTLQGISASACLAFQHVSKASEVTLLILFTCTLYFITHHSIHNSEYELQLEAVVLKGRKKDKDPVNILF